MIERVARALYARQPFHRFCLGEQDRDNPLQWGDLEEDERDDFMQEARAVIEAMRNPTDAMLEACQRALVNTMRDLGWSKEQRKGRLSAQTKSVMRWNAMIDAALK